MKRVVLVVNEFGMDGGGLSLSASQMKSMLESDYEFEVLLVDSSLWTRNELVVDGGYDKALTKSLGAELRLKQTLLELPPNVGLVIAFGGGFNAYIAMSLADALTVELIVCCRGTDANLIQWRQSDFSHVRAYKMARNVICLSEEQAHKIEMFAGVSRNRICVIPNVIDVPGHVCKVPHHGDVLLGCGARHLNEKKGVGLLIEMMAELKRVIPSVRLDLAGEVDEDLLENYKSRAYQLGVGTEVSFVGSLSRAEFKERMKKWCLYVQGSPCEGFSNSVAEAIEMGKGVVLTPTGYIAEFLRHEFPEAVFHNYEPKQMAAQVYRLLKIDALHTRFRKAYGRLAKVVSRQKVFDMWRSILEIEHTKSEVGPSEDPNLLVVLFHDIREDTHDGITVSPDEFRQFVDFVARQGYRCCSMKEAILESSKRSGKLLVMTFDDGYDGVLKYALPTLRRYGFSASVYVCTSTIGKWNDWNFKDKVRRRHLGLDELHQLATAGWEIGSHGVTHRSTLRLGERELVEELDASRHFLENEFGMVASYAYPYGDYNSFVRSHVALRYGYAMAMDHGGTFLSVDRYSIRRYMASEMLKILGGIK